MYKLKLLKGQASWSECPIDAPSVLIGRDHKVCRIVLGPGDDSVSRKHLEIVQEGQQCFVIDRKSKAGTSLNGRRLKADQPCKLHPNDLIQVCNYVLMFVDDHEPVDRSLDSVQISTEGSSNASSILQSSTGSWELRKGTNPEAKLTAIIKLTQHMRQCKTLEELLGKALDALLQLFAHAYRGIAVLTETQKKLSVSRVARYRAGEPEEIAVVSAAVIAEVVAKQVGILSDDHRVICAPLVNGDGQSLGMILLEARDTPGRFRTNDLDVLATVAVELSFAVENSILYEAALRERALQLELRVANQVQIGLLPSGPPEVNGYEFFDFYSPAKTVGGDYYDYIATESRRLAVVLGDVAGKGIPAALLMAKVSSELGVFVASGQTAAEVMQRVNSRFEKRSPEGAFVTMVLALLDPVSHEIVLVNAGHMPPLRRGPDGSVFEVGAAEAGFPLGVDPDHRYTEVRFSLAAGEWLILYSDGVIDAVNQAGKRYKVDRLHAVLSANLISARDVGQNIVDDLHKFVGDAQQFDDICLLCIGRRQDQR